MFRATLADPCCLQIEADNDGTQYIEVEIAREEGGDRVVYVVSSLNFTETEVGSFWEFQFTIDVDSEEGWHEAFQTQNRQMAAPYIPAEIRAQIVPIVCECLRDLANAVGAELIYRVTKEAVPDERALEKHHMLTQALENAGYFVEVEGTDPFGRRFWYMRKAIDAVP